MDDILTRIIETDEKARDITKKAQSDKIEKEQLILKEKETIYNEYIELAKSRIGKDIKKTKEKEKEKLDEAVKLNDQIKEKMQKHFDENKDRWVKEIYNNVIKG